MTTKYKLIENKSVAEALSAATRLAYLDAKLAPAPFHTSMTMLAGPLTSNQYVFVADENAIVAMIGWGSLDLEAAAIVSNNLRPLTIQEYKSGKLVHILLYCSPFNHTQDLLEFAINNATALKDVGEVSVVAHLTS